MGRPAGGVISRSPAPTRNVPSSAAPAPMVTGPVHIAARTRRHVHPRRLDMASLPFERRSRKSGPARGGVHDNPAESRTFDLRRKSSGGRSPGGRSGLILDRKVRSTCPEVTMHRAIVALLLAFVLAPATARAQGERLFRERIAPVLERRCVACHGETSPKAKLTLSTAQGIRAGGTSGPAE